MSSVSLVGLMIKFLLGEVAIFLAGPLPFSDVSIRGLLVDDILRFRFQLRKISKPSRSNTVVQDTEHGEQHYDTWPVLGTCEVCIPVVPVRTSTGTRALYAVFAQYKYIISSETTGSLP